MEQPLALPEPTIEAFEDHVQGVLDQPHPRRMPTAVAGLYRTLA